MNQESTNKYWKELEALKAGKTIQYRTSLVGNKWTPWSGTSQPSFMVDPGVEFRIQPEPHKWWLVANKNGTAWVEKYLSFSDAEVRIQEIDESIRCSYEIIHVIETP